jgi:hypothetical protein
MKPYIFIAAVLAGAISTSAQTSPQVKTRGARIYTQMSGEGEAVLDVPASDTYRFVSSEFSWHEKVVKDAPYSADSVTETRQTLADGNRIVRKISSQIYRDSEGRIRREQTLGFIGAWSAEQPQKTIFVNDPVAGVNYILEPNSRTARKILLPTRGSEATGSVGGGIAAGINLSTGGGTGTAHAVFLAGGNRTAALPSSGATQHKNEQLGKQIIEGIEAEGTRTTLTIPAGRIGNERPIEIVSERWYSPELQTVVMTKRSDPRFGETIYRLTNIQRGEPSPSLFVPPPDYTVKETTGPVDFHFQRKEKE